MIKAVPAPAQDFIRAIINEDVATNKHQGHVVTRFPPEPNGYLHIGHAKSICLNFGISEEYANAACYLRFDDTNPSKESIEFAESIKQDVRWLNYDWGERLRHASDYFDQLYDFALQLIDEGNAYVCSLSAEEIREYRGTLTRPGKDSPYRQRSVAENRALFQRMRAGEFEDGTHVLRAKIDMSSPNLNMRDPTLYRIKHESHHMTGDKWCVYPMYDFTQPISDALEGVTHSLCTLEFEDHRPLYDWVLEHTDVPCRPRQIEFSRLSLEYTVMSKRMLTQLVDQGHVGGWDDPRMPSIAGLRRRGYTPDSIRDFCERVGITKKDHVIEMGLLEHCVREDLDRRTPRRMAVLRPLRLVIDNYPEDTAEELDAPNHPQRPEMGTRKVPFSRVVYIERDDFMEDPPRKYYRLAPGREVRLRFAYLVTCVSVKKDEATGDVVEVHCVHDPNSRGGTAADGRKVKGTIHWVSAVHGTTAEIRLYDRLFSAPVPGKNSGNFLDDLNPHSLETVPRAVVEPALAQPGKETRFQFERLGYFCVDGAHTTGDTMVFNRTVTLRDSWAKVEKPAR